MIAKKAAHTPGPWQWWTPKTGRPKPYDLAKLIAPGATILSMYGGSGDEALGTSETDKANARLISAAPDMLFVLKLERAILNDEAWACEYLTDRALNDERPAATLARLQDAAIAKAELNQP